ncbi:MAG: aminopeptidase P family protein [Myxococcaceae bacterium]|nr:aminopeptidase P family protein [Myxococcaceae bacterium]
MNDRADQLQRFTEVQQLAYRCVESVAEELDPGITEKQAATLLTDWLEREGIDDWFHRPFAWFGDRTAFAGRWHPLKFFPSSRRLEPGMPFILDVAPVKGGVAADVGYAGSLGKNPILELLLADLAEYRSLIVRLVNERVPFAEISRRVDVLAARHGYEVRHRAYPFGVLAHLVTPVEQGPRQGSVGGFGIRTLTELGRQAWAARREGWSPLWNAQSNHPPVPGIWAVEPHLAFRGVGAKFEELLVVDEAGARWLDDDLPHVRRWTQAARGVAA